MLKETRVDGYGSECTAGLRVIIGNYLLLYKELNKGKLFKKDDKDIVVYSETVMHICSMLAEKKVKRSTMYFLDALEENEILGLLY